MRGSSLRVVSALMVAAIYAGACGSPSPTITPPQAGGGSGDPTDRPGRSGDRSGSPSEPAPSNPAPEFTVTTFDGEEFDLAAQRGRPVVLNFFESW